MTLELTSILGDYGEGCRFDVVLTWNLTYPEDATALTKVFLDAYKCAEGVHSIPRNNDVILKYRSSIRSWKVSR